MAVIEQVSVEVRKPGWFEDPRQVHNLRYFDGQFWTDHVTHFGPSPCTGCNYEDDVMARN